MADYRNVWALILAVALLQLAGGALGVVTPLGLEALGVSPLPIGLIAALHAAGFMVGAATAPNLIVGVGNIRVFAAAAAATAAGALAMQLAQDPWAWTLIRFVQGVSFAWMFASAESWLTAATPAESRGGVTGVYHVAAKAALVIGPFFAAGLGPLAPQPYIWCGVFLALALMPVCLTRRNQPPPPSADPLPLMALARLAPAAVAGAFLAGVVNTGTLALLPVFAVILSPDLERGATEAGALAMAAAWIGGLASQWPAGRISDRVDRRRVVAVMAAAAAIAALGVGMLAGRAPFAVILGLLAVWGAGSLSFYGVCIAHAADRSTPDQIARVMSGLLFVWAAGSVAGPPLSGFAMRIGLGPGGLFVWAAALTVLLAVLMLVRRQARAPAEEGAREAWLFTQPTSVPGVSNDPRSDVI